MPLIDSFTVEVCGGQTLDISMVMASPEELAWQCVATCCAMSRVLAGLDQPHADEPKRIQMIPHPYSHRILLILASIRCLQAPCKTDVASKNSKE